MRKICPVLALLAYQTLSATVYYVDFQDGKDTRSGTSPNQAWKHSPGDRAAEDKAASCQLAPGDTIKLKGGIDYIGEISIGVDGVADSPITIDGNSDDSYGQGPATIWGSVPMPPNSWKQCRNADEAEGSESWRNIYYTDIDGTYTWETLHLHNRDTIFPVSQDPNMPDPHYQEMASAYHKSNQQIREERNFSIQARNMKENGQRPLVMMFDGLDEGAGAVIDNYESGQILISLDKPQRIVRIGYTAQPRYTNPRKILFDFDEGKTTFEIDAEPAGAKPAEKIYELKSPVTFKDLSISFDGVYPTESGKINNWGAIRSLAAYDDSGRNILHTERRSYYQNKDVFDQKDPHYWEGATAVFYAKPTLIYAHDIISYNPSRSEIEIELFKAAQYNDGGSFALMNSTRIMDMPGEYTVRSLPNGQTRVFYWPTPQGFDGLRYAKYDRGLDISASHIVVRGVQTRGQCGKDGGSGIYASVKAGTGLHIDRCDVGMVRGQRPALTVRGLDNSIIENTAVHDNTGHARGIVARSLKGMTVRNCTMYRNTGTALDYYTVENGAVLDCRIYDNQGMHANGLTFYAGCKNIIVDGNEIYDGNVGITFQDGQNLLIRNNIIVSKHSFGIGIWAGKVFENVVISNNYIEGAIEDSTRNGAIYGGNPGINNLAIYNNIVVGGFEGNVLQKAEYNHNLFCDLGDLGTSDIINQNSQTTDANALFVNAPERNYLLSVNSAARGIGMSLGALNQFDKNGVQRSGKVDAGPYQGTSSVNPKDSTKTVEDYTLASQFPFSGSTTKGKDYSLANFAHTSSEPTAIVSGASFSDQQGGSVKVKEATHSIYGWDDEGHTLTWTVSVPEAGDYEIVINQATLSAAKRDFSVNNEPIAELQDLPMTYTGSWNKYVDHYIPAKIHLEEGENKITIGNAGGSLNVMNLRAYKLN